MLTKKQIESIFLTEVALLSREINIKDNICEKIKFESDINIHQESARIFLKNKNWCMNIFKK